MHDQADLELRAWLEDDQAERQHVNDWKARQLADLAIMKQRKRWPWYRRLAAWLRRQWI